MLAVLGDRARRRIVLQREIQRDAVGGQRDFLRGVGAVVADVVPRRRAGDEGRVQFLDPVQRCDRLLAVDDDVAFLIEQGGVMRPQRPVRKAVAVALGVAEREAGRLAGLLQLLAEFEEAGMLRNAVDEFLVKVRAA